MTETCKCSHCECSHRPVVESASQKAGFQFQDGDIVEFGGLVDVVRINTEEKLFPVYAVAEKFTLDGKLYDHHNKPLLVLIERPKKKAKKTIEYWVNVYASGPVGIHKSKETADGCADIDRIACVKLTGEYEV